MRTLARVAPIAALVIAAAAGLASPASAHVTVAGDATRGGYGVLTFRVPTESDTASTVELRVTLPDDSPLIFANPQHKPGWTATVTKKKLPTPRNGKNGAVWTEYVSQVDWKADSTQAAIPPEQFDMFSIKGGPFPNTESLAFPAEQFYSDGHSVNFNQNTVAGQPEPINPTPALTLASRTFGDGGAASVASPAHDYEKIAITALVIAIVALLGVAGNLAVLRRRLVSRRPSRQ